jgi:hypothetical protein
VTARLFHLPPTPHDRHLRRANALAGVRPLFELDPADDEPIVRCPVCGGGDHCGPCPHGTAPRLANLP